MVKRYGWDTSVAFASQPLLLSRPTSLPGAFFCGAKEGKPFGCILG